MSVDAYKAHKLKRAYPKKDIETWSPAKKHRFKERGKGEKFLHFCDIVLAYTKYEPAIHDVTEVREVRVKNNTSPSGGSTAESFTSESSTTPVYPDMTRDGNLPPLIKKRSDAPSADDDSLDLVTCFCMKPFGGRPMIECSDCLTWIHLSCAKIRRNNIPDEFTCQHCKENKLTKRKSDRIRPDRKKTPSPVP